MKYETASTEESCKVPQYGSLLAITLVARAAPASASVPWAVGGSVQTIPSITAYQGPDAHIFATALTHVRRNLPTYRLYIVHPVTRNGREWWGIDLSYPVGVPVMAVEVAANPDQHTELVAVGVRSAPATRRWFSDTAYTTSKTVDWVWYDSYGHWLTQDCVSLVYSYDPFDYLIGTSSNTYGYCGHLGSQGLLWQELNKPFCLYCYLPYNVDPYPQGESSNHLVVGQIDSFGYPLEWQTEQNDSTVDCEIDYDGSELTGYASGQIYETGGSSDWSPSGKYGSTDGSCSGRFGWYWQLNPTASP